MHMWKTAIIVYYAVRLQMNVLCSYIIQIHAVHKFP